MNVFASFDTDDAKKSRRSLLAVSVFTLIFATFNITSDELEFLNFSLEISHIKIVKVGQVSSLILILIFLLRVVPQTILSLKKSSLERLERIEGQETRQLQESWGWDDNVDYDASPEGEAEHLGDRQRYRKTKSEKAFDHYFALAQATGTIVLDIMLPITIGFLAVLHPYLLVSAIDNDQLQLFQFFTEINRETSNGGEH